jgi:hypothetical protein
MEDQSLSFFKRIEEHMGSSAVYVDYIEGSHDGILEKGSLYEFIRQFIDKNG